MKNEKNLPFRLLFKQKRSELGFSQKDVAEKTNTSPTLISKYEKGLSKPRIETAKRIAEVLGIDLDTLIRSLDREDIHLIKIPFYTSNEIDDGYFHIASNMLPSYINSDNLITYRQLGDAMSPLFQNGDILLIDKSDKEVRTNKSFLIEIGEYSGIKQITSNDFANEYIIHSIDTKYPPIYEKKDNVAIVGRVIWYSRLI